VRRSTNARRGLAALAAALLLGGAAGADGPAPAAALIPPAGKGLELRGEPAIYAGERLYDYIDGGAPQVLEYGFLEAASQELMLNGRTYILDVYRMRDPLAALGLFSVRRPPRPTPIGAFPFSCRVSSQGLLAHGPYYVEIAAYESVPETEGEMEQLARRVTSGVPAAFAPDELLRRAPFASLPGLGRVAGSERLARGPVSLRTALGRDAGGPLGRLLDALQPGSTSDPGAGVEPAATWVVAGYHAAKLDDPASASATIAVSVAPRDPDALWEAARRALPAGGAMANPNPQAWVASLGEGQASLFGVRRGADVALGASSLPAEVLESWVGSLAAPEPAVGGR
jgi:hypothetical protein